VRVPGIQLLEKQQPCTTCMYVPQLRYAVAVIMAKSFSIHKVLISGVAAEMMILPRFVSGSTNAKQLGAVSTLEQRARV